MMLDTALAELLVLGGEDDVPQRAVFVHDLLHDVARWNLHRHRHRRSTVLWHHRHGHWTCNWIEKKRVKRISYLILTMSNENILEQVPNITTPFLLYFFFFEPQNFIPCSHICPFWPKSCPCLQMCVHFFFFPPSSRCWNRSQKSVPADHHFNDDDDGVCLVGGAPSYFPGHILCR